MHKLHWCALAIYFFSIGCSNVKDESDKIYYQPENAKVFADSLTFHEMGHVSLPLDSVTAMTSSSVYMYEPEGAAQRIYSMIAADEKAINLYDYDKKTLIGKVPIEKGGPNGIGVGHGFLSHYLISPDSILISNNWTFKLYLLNHNGEVLKKYNIMDTLIFGQNQAIPLTATDKPIQVRNNIAYLIGSLNDPLIKDHTQVSMVIGVNLQTGEVSRSMARPPVYNIGNWGKNYLHFSTFGTFNPDNGHFVYSFSADPYIYETDHGTMINKHYAGSKYFEKVLPMSYNKKAKYDNEESAVYDFTTPSYYKIIYDPYNKLYYRSAFLPITEDDYQDANKRFNRQEEISILDTNFRKLGEFAVPRYKYVFTNYFVTKEGLHMLLKPELHQTEDSMTYVIFKPTAIK